MKEFLKLIRWQNLLIVILTMVLMRYAVIESLLGKVNVQMKEGLSVMIPMTLQFSLVDFIILVAATVLITAGGYVINDYFDIKTDLINRGKVIVGTKISRRRAMLWHTIFNIAGVLAGFYVSIKVGYFWIGVLFLMVTGLLYFYSASYKRQFLIGNLIVAILTAMVPFMVILFEWPALYRFYSENVIDLPNLMFLFYWIGGFSLFAFLTTLTREIIKDIEDFEGDLAYGRKTIPVVIGIPASKIVSVILISCTLILLYLIWFFFVHDTITLTYITVLLTVPLLFVIYQITISRNKRQVHGASTLMKLIMLAGILYSVAVKIILTWNLF